MRKLILIVASLVIYSSGFSQSLSSGGITSSGGSSSNENGFIYWTAGEPFVGTFSATSGSLTHELFANSQLLVTGIEDPEAIRRAKVYPNPSSDRLWVELPNDSETYHLQILSAIGREVTSLTVSGNSDKMIDTSFLSTGLYILRLRRLANDTVKSFKIIVRK